MNRVDMVSPDFVVVWDLQEIQNDLLLEIPLVVGSRVELPPQGFHLVRVAGKVTEKIDHRFLVALNDVPSDQCVRGIGSEFRWGGGVGGQFNRSKQQAGDLQADIAVLVRCCCASIVSVPSSFRIDQPLEDRPRIQSIY